MKKSFQTILLTLFILFFPIIVYGQSDLFEIRTPNVMIIFDTSSSMDLDVNGGYVLSGNAKGVDGVIRNYQGYEVGRARGGDHPNSKLYQAKQALRNVIKDIENVNLGFATYGQRKLEKWRGYYKKCKPAQAEKYWCEKRYWRWRSVKGALDRSASNPYISTSFSSDSFIDVWGNLHTGITSDTGYEFKRTVSNYYYDKANSSIPPHSNLKKKDVEITYQVERKFNAEYGWYEYRYYSKPFDYDWYEETIKVIDSCTKCSPDEENNPFPLTWPDGGNPPWQTYFKNDSRGPAYQDEYEKPFGNSVTKKNWWDCKTNSQPAKDYCWDYDYGWRTYTGVSTSVCKDQTDGWLYVSGCHDVSEYYYPIGPLSPALPPDQTRPHTWSYFRITGNSWKDNQPDPYYPAISDDPGKSDNNYFFLNFPEVDDSLNEYVNKKKILQWLDLTPVQNPETFRWHTKLPLKSDSITSNTIESLYTPLADTLYQAKKYFNDYIYKYKGGDSATKSICRGNYIILMTDGLESARLKDGNPDYDAAPQAAKELYELVKTKDGKPAGVKTFVIGFGADLKGNKPEVLNNIAKNGGTEKAYFASNLSELETAFKKIFQTIGEGYSRSNPVVAATRDKIYRGYFNLPGWEGHLLAFGLDSKGDIDKEKYPPNGIIWDAGEIMNIVGRGKIYTWTDDNPEPDKVEFKPGNSEKLKFKGNDLLNPSPEEDLNWDSLNLKIGDGKIDKEDSETIINFVLDPSFGKYEIQNPEPPPERKWAPFPYKGKRSPKANPPYPTDSPICWKLGDIYHSTPLIVGKPPFKFSDGENFSEKYSTFINRVKNRQTMIYVGANDGMLHAFSEDGKEKFSIIPRNLLSKLREIRNDHQFFVDSSPRAYDVFFKKGKKKGYWRTVLVSGERGGGTYYFALDITDPEDPQILWEITDSRMGYTWSRPELGRVKIKGEEKFVAFVGGGYTDPKDPKNENIGNTFYIIDLEDGEIIKRFSVGDKSNRIPSGATAFDKDLDGRVDAVYFGDIKGSLWKIEISGENIDDWKLIELFKSDGGNPIFYPPAVTKNNQGKVLIYFGQGDELNLFEKEKTYYFYEIWDKGSEGEKIWKTEGDLKLKPGEKILASPSIGNNVVYFTTWEYTGIEDNCGAGIGRLYGLTTSRFGVQGGLASLFYDISGTKLEKPVKSIELGKGIPSAPIIIPGRIYISTSLNANNIITITIPSWGRGRLKYWREIF